MENKIDFCTAETFVNILDPTAEQFTFQALPESQENGCSPQVIHSNLSGAISSFNTLQEKGAGIFVTINETDLNGRAASNITRIRAIFADCDEVDYKPVTDKLPPHIVIESSPGRYHVYWLVSDCELSQFKPVQQAIAVKFGTDPAVCDLSRLMRLPGSWHQKGDPSLTKILSSDAEKAPYTLEEIISGLEINIVKNSTPAKSYHIQPEPIEKIRSALKALPDQFVNEYGSWRNVAFALHFQFQGDEIGFQLFDEWSEKASNYGETEKLWESIRDSGQNAITIASLYYWATQNGWVWTKYAKTDLGNADRFVDQFGTNVCYLDERKIWLLWNVMYWEVDNRNQVKNLAIQTVRNIKKEVAATTDDAERTALAKFASNSQAAARISSILEIAKCNPNIAKTLADLDTNPWLFNCRNGTINLKTGDFYTAQQGDFITKSSPVIYDSNAKCPLWNSFLDAIFAGDQELIKFVKIAAGYSLTGIINDEALFFLHGSGANGKSTFIGIITEILGDYTIKLSLESLLKKRNGDGIPNDIARLKGARFCVASEVDQDGRFNESKLKDLASRDTMTARFLHGEFFDFKQSHKLWIYGNHKPVIQGSDDGIWRRIKLIPFNVTFSEEERDLGLDVKLSNELSGIFNWALEGCKEWQKDGLSVPDSIKNATAEYRDEMDIVGSFIADHFEIGENLTIPAKEIQMTYRGWCELNGFKAMSSKWLHRQLEAKGIKRNPRTANGFVYQGIGKITDANRHTHPILTLVQN